VTQPGSTVLRLKRLPQLRQRSWVVLEDWRTVRIGPCREIRIEPDIVASSVQRPAQHPEFEDRAAHWRAQAQAIRDVIIRRAWNPQINSFAATLDGTRMDASLLLLHEVGFLAADDPRFAGTVAMVERELRRGDFVFRYMEKDSLGEPTNAFLVCTFWFISALAAIGRRDEARALFARVLAKRNHHGLMAEHVDPVTYEQWGNYVQTYSMVGLVICAIRLSDSWDQAF
jgi:GH15 family glucan-1,4-alpha-glucosidase